ncbi:MAG: GNAT family N-acetyltransferase [Dehalococcoidales bacterium]|nr:GNAT family N-acetyltransferase [Dehalococcoidales bacterium]
MLIREIAKNEPLERSVEVISASFGTVAKELNLTEENNPSHPSFMTLERLQEARDKGLTFFGGFEGGVQVGFVALEDAGEGVFYLERLAVLPEYRHKGYGLGLVNHALHYAGDCGGKKVSIGIIDEQIILKDWYRDIGFVHTGTRKFDHLPFTVGFMEIRLVSSD